MITPPLSPSLSSSFGEERVVRFDNECVLIPESVLCSKRPKLITKSYSLPLWKKKAAAVSDTELDLKVNEENHIVLRVPVPRYFLCVRITGFKAD